MRVFSFKQFVTSRASRRRLNDWLAFWVNLRQPSRVTPKYLRRLLRQLLDPDTAAAGERLLAMVDRPAVPAVLVAAADPNYQLAEWPCFTTAPPPLEAILGSLNDHAPLEAVGIAIPLTRAGNANVRPAAGETLARSGEAAVLGVVEHLFRDPDEVVRDHTCSGVRSAVIGGRASDEYRRRAYPLVLAMCDADESADEAADCLATPDPARAACDFAHPDRLNVWYGNVKEAIGACNRRATLLPAAGLRRLLDQTLPVAAKVGYPLQYIAAAALVALANADGEAARPVIEAATSHVDGRIHEAAAGALVRLAGMADPFRFVCELIEQRGFDALTRAQQGVYLACRFEGEVCNGGLMQFFAIPSGDQVIEALASLRRINHATSVATLEAAIRLVGPLVLEPEQDMRLAAFEGRYNTLKEQFGPLETTFYDVSSRPRQQVTLYAVRHADEFRPG